MTIEETILNKMIAKAKKAQNNSYSLYSNFAVGAAILSDSGKIYASCNVEVAHFKSICAEAGAISSMISDGGKKIDTILIISPNDESCPPCGDCRQRILEFSTANTKIITVDVRGENLKKFTLDELLPHSFTIKK